MPAILPDIIVEKKIQDFCDRVSKVLQHPIAFSKSLHLIYAENWKADNRELRELLKTEFKNNMIPQQTDITWVLLDNEIDTLMNDLRKNG